MALVKNLEEKSKKWMQIIIATGSILLGYLLNAFMRQLSHWFDLEAKISSYGMISQIVAIVVSVLVFFGLYRKVEVKQYLHEVYTELTKVVWSDREGTIKLTIGIVVALILASIVLGIVDISVSRLLGLLYK